MSITVLGDNTMVRDPSPKDVREYAEFIGIDLEKESHLEWIAHDGLCAPVPHPWKACTENGQDVFYFNFDTGESVWDHPCDEKYRNMVRKYKEHHIAHRFLPSPAMEATLEDMWCTGIKSHKQTFDEIRSQVEAKCNVYPQICLVPDQFPGFVQKLAEFAEITQKDIDDAWLDAAIDVLGRPAFRGPSDGNSFVYSYRGGALDMDVDFPTLTHVDDQRTLSTYDDAARESLGSFLDDASSSDWTQHYQFFLNRRPDQRRAIERTPQDDDQVFLSDGPSP